MLDNWFKISVIICAIFFIIKLILNISFWISLNFLIFVIKKQVKNLNSNTSNLLSKLEDIASDISSVTTLLNVKKTKLKQRKRTIKEIRSRVERRREANKPKHSK